MSFSEQPFLPQRRALLLQQMGIEQWTLRRPQTLQGASSITVGESVSLLIISDQTTTASEFLQDIYRALGIQAQQCVLLNHEQLARLKLSHPIALWFVGEPLNVNQSLSNTAQAALQAMPQITSDGWQILQQSPQAKRQLWQQLQQFQLQGDVR
ncbi:DNA polymerase III subunit psi [Testudinibacter sp. TR-2022]|uniref:DNA polymerase III subunit psi n=1 Tax=Testudinibacter sp. TR-2022 TaxID=2585029 RepID=UPI00111B649F|nr:DNA polymerase III subunit psi [Testudinibacter sp. TR-2022]TNH04971.1 DNA polymerase III subunit psi [Pasteurellaceae bacterium Phil31]TNH09322.1 DNA polymerase III subunit psi [Testudinibacter sp. TR-2022]TNH09624.1 DNA polymerase III subunit psi [Testudinibacter sp. TR-2022]TNH13481.1 DNA polymerase III subunit psi [Testudinibacter sp. TR-2022]TNH19149.1 DNA polymerase III subunit psi [Testudinibacter sp. TR-2022]